MSVMYESLGAYECGKGLFEQLKRVRGLNIPHDFLEPSKENEYSYSRLHNMDKALDLTVRAIKDNWRILVVLDTDVDGIMSGAMVYQYLRDNNPNATGFNLKWVIGEGKRHGLEQYDMMDLTQFDLIIACDSLSNEFDIYEELYDSGTKVILLDHHDCGEASSYAITVNSEMHGYPNRHLSGAGVCYKFLQGLDDRFGLNEADNYVDLACVGIIADVMDMTSMENRSICYRGLQNLNNYGLKKIIGSYKFDSNSVSFSIAPIINACQRAGDNKLAANIILDKDKKFVRACLEEAGFVRAQQRKEVNEEFESAKLQVDFDPHNGYCVAFVANRNLSGLVATKMADFYQKPALALYTNENEEYFTGSLRSPNGFDFKEIVNKTHMAQADGHIDSAGVYVMKDTYSEFKSDLDWLLDNTPKDVSKPVDFELDLKDINDFMMFDMERINKVAGKGFKRVSFIVRDVAPINIAKMKDTHTTFEIDGITFFKWNDTKMYEMLKNDECWGFDLIGSLETSNFRGKRSVNFIIEDFIPIDELDL